MRTYRTMRLEFIKKRTKKRAPRTPQLRAARQRCERTVAASIATLIIDHDCLQTQYDHRGANRKIIDVGCLYYNSLLKLLL